MSTVSIASTIRRQKIGRRTQILIIDFLWVFYKALLKGVALLSLYIAELAGSILLLGSYAKTKKWNFVVTLPIKLVGLVCFLGVFLYFQLILLVLGALAQLAGLVKGDYTRAERLYIWTVPAILLLVFPFKCSDEFLVYQVAQVASFAIILFGMNILSGFAGLVSMGHSVFVLLGSYGCALAYTKLLSPLGTAGYFASVLIGGVFTAVIGFLFAIPAVRVKGPYLGIMTLGIAVSVPSLMKTQPLLKWIGGMDGVFVTAPAVPHFLEASVRQDIWNYFIVMSIAVVMFVLGNRILKGQIGRAGALIRQEEGLAPVVGLNAVITKLLFFAVSAFYAGIGGGALTLMVGYINPDSYTFMDSIMYFVALCIGGFGSILGSVLAAVYMNFQGEIFTQLSKHVPALDGFRSLIYGVVLLLFILIARTGLSGEIRRLMAFWFFALPKRGASSSVIPPDLKASEVGLSLPVRKT